MANILSNWAGRIFSNWMRFGQTRQIGGVFFYPAGGSGFTYKELEYLNAFEEIPELNAIISLKANAFSNGCVKSFIPNRDGSLTEDPKDPVVALLKRPTFFQAEKEFMKQTKCFKEIFGNEYLYANAGVGTKKLSNFPTRVKSFSTLPPNLVECEYDQTAMPFFDVGRDEYPTDKIKYTYFLGAGKEKVLDNDMLIHFNDNRVSIKDARKKDFLKGESKMKALTAAINNIKMAYETRGVILANRGALGIISNDGSDAAGQVPLAQEERDELHRQYSDNYGGLSGQKSLIITNARVKFQAMTVAPDKLGLFDECLEDFFKMCDSYGTPQELFSSSKGTTFENQKEAYKRLYDSTIVPEANEWISGLQAFFYPNRERILMIDYSHLSVFQEDVSLKADNLSKTISSLSTALKDKAITIQEYQSELNKLGMAVALTEDSPSQNTNEKDAQTAAAQSSLRGSVGGVQGLLSIQQGVVAGTTTYESGISMLTIIYGFTQQEASALLGEPKTNNNQNGQPSN